MAMPRAARALSPSPALCGMGSASTRPAIQAAGIISKASTTNPHTPMRQPYDCVSAWPMGAAIIAPTEPAADTMPSTELRTATGTGRDAAAMASALPVQASEAPMHTPAPSTTPSRPLVVASRTRPRM
jgi:hypothetical protein